MACGLSCSVACGIFPDQGSNPCFLHWQVDSLPLSHQGSPLIMVLISLITNKVEQLFIDFWPFVCPPVKHLFIYLSIFLLHLTISFSVHFLNISLFNFMDFDDFFLSV